ncbi:hypothetical protein M8J75_013373 [Diaphorina citri]|nr:hypothetical protein M8J75_013373 [Diaphorina citri]
MKKEKGGEAGEEEVEDEEQKEQDWKRRRHYNKEALREYKSNRMVNPKTYVCKYYDAPCSAYPCHLDWQGFLECLCAFINV